MNDRAYLEEKISNLSLAHLALYLVKKGGDVNSVFDILDGRIDTDSRGAYMKSGGRFYAYYETPIKDTALFVKAHAAARRDSPMLDKSLRWLLNSRDKDGAWGSTNNTLAVVDAFSELLEWKRETESEFDAVLLFDGKEKAKFSFAQNGFISVFYSNQINYVPKYNLQLFSLQYQKKPIR